LGREALVLGGCSEEGITSRGKSPKTISKERRMGNFARFIKYSKKYL